MNSTMAPNVSGVSAPGRRTGYSMCGMRKPGCPACHSMCPRRRRPVTDSIRCLRGRRRCLRCDVCIGCGMCMAACGEMGVEALRMGDTYAGRLAYFDFTRPANMCIGCGACTQVCPTGAMHIEDIGGVRRTIITGTIVREQPLLTCSDCGAPTRTPAHRDIVRRRVQEHMAAHQDRELCPACARRRADRPEVIVNHSLHLSVGG